MLTPVVSPAAATLLCLCALGQAPSPAMQSGRFDTAKRQAIGYLESDQYDKAAGKLEEIWEEEQTDPWVAEHLALAYFNGNERAYRPEIARTARDLVNKAIALGGTASFLVQHAHGALSLGTFNNFCAGTLSIGQGKIAFMVRAGKGTQDHSFSLDLRAVGVSEAHADGGFHIKTKARNYLMLPRSRNKEDGDLISSLLRQQTLPDEAKKGK